MQAVITKVRHIPPRNAVKIAILLGMGVYFLVNILTGNLSNYINTRFAWLSWVAVILLFALGLVDLWAQVRPTPADTPMHTGWGIIGICALPLFLGVLIPSQPLGLEAVNGTLSTTVSVSSSTVITRDPAKRNILDWLRAFALQADKRAFDGVRAELSGFIYRDPDFPAGQFMLGRFVMSCCTADASPIGLPIYAPQASDLPEGQWVNLKGAFQTGEFRGTLTPILHADAVEPIDTPQNTYLYP